MDTLARRCAIAAVICWLAGGAWPGRGFAAIENAECFSCHSDKDLAKDGPGGAKLSMFVDEAAFTHSIHGQLECTACHGDIAELPHAETLKPVSCSACHQSEAGIYLSSDHGKAVGDGKSEAAACQICHGEPHRLLPSRDPASPVHRANVPQMCENCHANAVEMEKHMQRQSAVTVSYDKSVHGLAHAAGKTGAAVCSDCHGAHDLNRAGNVASRLNWQKLPETCGKCHDDVRQAFERSVHGRAVAAGVRNAPICTDCHGEHTIQAVSQAASQVAPSHIPDTCGQCHGAERIATRNQMDADVVDTYMKSFHGLGMALGGATVANCASCHGVHDILPSSDPLSSVNKANLPQTCGKCHPGIGTRLAQADFRIHAPPGAAKGKPWVVNFIARIYVVVIVITIGGMLAFNGLDYWAKARAHIRAVRAMPATATEDRLGKAARVQHAALIILFIVLAYTGFVHKYPDSFWGWPFHEMENGGSVRSLIHRVAGWAFTALFLAHLIAVVATPRGHAFVRHIGLRLYDLNDSFATLLHNLGLRRAPPPPRRFNFAEKVEYWALLWGSVVMIVTGVMLIFTETVLRTLPKVWHDVAQVIHFYEAVLATLAIIIWHFYWVIFDPKEYPMNPAWFLGRRPVHHADAEEAAPTETHSTAASRPDGPAAPG